MPFKLITLQNTSPMTLKVERAWVDRSWWGLFSEHSPWKWGFLLYWCNTPALGFILKTETESTGLGALRERCVLWLRDLMPKRKSHSYGDWNDSGCCSGRWVCSAGWRLLSSPPLIITNHHPRLFQLLFYYAHLFHICLFLGWSTSASLCSQLLELRRGVVNLPCPSVQRKGVLDVLLTSRSLGNIYPGLLVCRDNP